MSGKPPPGCRTRRAPFDQQRPAAAPGRLWRLLLNGDRRLLAAGVAASLLNAVVTLALIAHIKTLLSGALAYSPWIVAAQMLGLLLLILVAHFCAGRCISQLGAMALLRLRRDTAAAILATDDQRLERIGQGRIYAAFAEDLPKLGAAFSVLPTVLLNSVLSVAAIAYLAWVSWVHTLFMLVLMGAAVVISEWVLLRRVKYYSGRFREAMNTLYEHIGALVYGHKELQLNRARRRFFQQHLLQPGLQDIYATVRRRDDYTSAYSAWSITVSLFLVSAVILAGHVAWPMSQPVMMVFALVLLYLRGPVIGVINNIPHLLTAQVALRQLAALGLADNADEETVPATPALPWRELVLDAVTYQYRHATARNPDADTETTPPAGSAPGHHGGDDSFTLGPLSLRLTPGEVVFICGGNGSGKSTLARLLTGLYRPAGGCFRVDGRIVDIHNSADRAAYQARFSAVFGDYYLFSQVLDSAGNLHRDDWIQQQLRHFELGQKVRAHNGCFTTTILSQGQRKRLALITALAEDRPILLLDEWAAEQDPQFRCYFYQQLIPALRAQGKTIIAITHDDHYFHIADRLLRMDQGQLVENR